MANSHKSHFFVNKWRCICWHYVSSKDYDDIKNDVIICDYMLDVTSIMQLMVFSCICGVRLINNHKIKMKIYIFFLVYGLINFLYNHFGLKKVWKVCFSISWSTHLQQNSWTYGSKNDKVSQKNSPKKI